jgi:hypothetical protein
MPRPDKLFPAAVHDDQEKIAMAEMEPVVLGHIPFSSNDPRTERVKFEPLEDQQARMSASGDTSATNEDKKAADWKAEVEAASSQDELDAVVASYADTGAEYKTVEDAIEKKQAEINES